MESSAAKKRTNCRRDYSQVEYPRATVTRINHYQPLKVNIKNLSSTGVALLLSKSQRAIWKDLEEGDLLYLDLTDISKDATSSVVEVIRVESHANYNLVGVKFKTASKSFTDKIDEEVGLNKIVHALHDRKHTARSQVVEAKHRQTIKLLFAEFVYFIKASKNQKIVQPKNCLNDWVAPHIDNNQLWLEPPF